jgi:chitin disaccharide deacetylase
MTKQLIVTADDFGLTEGVNRAIGRAHQEGIVTSASLMVSGAAFESAVELARQNPRLDIGLHLDLTNKPFALAVRTNKLDLERRIRSQIEKAIATGLHITHLDGHKHVHVIPAVLKVIRAVTPEYGIRAIRTMNVRTTGMMSLLHRNPGARAAIIQQFLFAEGARVAWKLSLPNAMAGPDSFYGIAETGFLDLRAFANIIRELTDGAHEIMCHPGYLDDDLRQTPTRLLTQRERELEMLTGREVRDLIRNSGIELISYRNLVDMYGTHRTDSLLNRCSAL